MCSKTTLNYWEAHEQVWKEESERPFTSDGPSLAGLLLFIVVLFDDYSVGAYPSIWLIL